MASCPDTRARSEATEQEISLLDMALSFFACGRPVRFGVSLSKGAQQQASNHPTGEPPLLSFLPLLRSASVLDLNLHLSLSSPSPAP